MKFDDVMWENDPSLLPITPESEIAVKLGVFSYVKATGRPPKNLISASDLPAYEVWLKKQSTL